MSVSFFHVVQGTGTSALNLHLEQQNFKFRNICQRLIFQHVGAYRMLYISYTTHWKLTACSHSTLTFNGPEEDLGKLFIFKINSVVLESPEYSGFRYW